MASGSFFAGLYRFGGFVQWAASVQETSPGIWEGSIRGVWGHKELLPYKDVKIEVPNGGVLVYSPAEMTVTFRACASSYAEAAVCFPILSHGRDRMGHGSGCNTSDLHRHRSPPESARHVARSDVNHGGGV